MASATKRTPSPAQLAARAAFAERQRARSPAKPAKAPVAPKRRRKRARKPAIESEVAAPTPVSSAASADPDFFAFVGMEGRRRGSSNLPLYNGAYNGARAEVSNQNGTFRYVWTSTKMGGVGGSWTLLSSRPLLAK